MNKKLAHLIVGFPIYSYFVNAINSVLSNDTDSTILIITTGNRKFFGWGGRFDYDFKDEIKIKNYSESLKEKFPNLIIIYKNIKHKDYNKTGALYDAYNLALRISKKLKIDFLNIIQNDFQLMWWNKNFIKIADELFEKNKNVINLSCRFFNPKSISKPLVKNIYLFSLKKKKKNVH